MGENLKRSLLETCTAAVSAASSAVLTPETAIEIRENASVVLRLNRVKDSLFYHGHHHFYREDDWPEVEASMSGKQLMDVHKIHCRPGFRYQLVATPPRWSPPPELPVYVLRALYPTVVFFIERVESAKVLRPSEEPTIVTMHVKDTMMAVEYSTRLTYETLGYEIETMARIGAVIQRSLTMPDRAANNFFLVMEKATNQVAFRVSQLTSTVIYVTHLISDVPSMMWEGGHQLYLLVSRREQLDGISTHVTDIGEAMGEEVKVTAQGRRSKRCLPGQCQSIPGSRHCPKCGQWARRSN